MLKYDGRHIFSVFLPKVFPLLAVPRNDLRIKRLIAALPGIRSAVKQIQFKNIPSASVGCLNGNGTGSTPVNPFRLFPDAVRELFVNMAELILIGNPDLRIMIAECYRKRNPALCHRL